MFPYVFVRRYWSLLLGAWALWFGLTLVTEPCNQSGRRTLRFPGVVLWLTAAILLFRTVTSLLTEFDNPTLGPCHLGEDFGQLPSCPAAGGWAFASTLDYTTESDL